MSDKAERPLRIRDFPGLVISAGPDETEAGSSVIQENATAIRPGELTVRRGYRNLLFKRFAGPRAVPRGTGELDLAAIFATTETSPFNGYLLANGTNFFTVSSFTVSVWVKFYEFNEYIQGEGFGPVRVIGKGGWRFGDFSDQIENGCCLSAQMDGTPVLGKARVQYVRNLTLTEILWPELLVPDRWYHFVYGYDSVQDRIFMSVDGADRLYAAVLDTVTPEPAFPFGAAYHTGSTSASLKGTMDKIGYWHRVLTLNQGRWLYNEGSGLEVGRLVRFLRPNLVAYWGLNDDGWEDEFGENDFVPGGDGLVGLGPPVGV